MYDRIALTLNSEVNIYTQYVVGVRFVWARGKSSNKSKPLNTRRNKI